MKYAFRTPVIVVAVAAILGVTAVGVQASPTCQRLVRQYREKVAHHKFSQATLARWSEWGKAHPNYHAPKRRPKLTPQETYSKLNYACEVEVPAALRSNFELPSIPPVDAPISESMLTEVALTPPVEPIFSLTNPTIVPAPAVGVETPEPAGIVLLGTGIALMAIFRKRLRKPELAAA